MSIGVGYYRYINLCRLNTWVTYIINKIVSQALFPLIVIPLVVTIIIVRCYVAMVAAIIMDHDVGGHAHHELDASRWWWVMVVVVVVVVVMVVVKNQSQLCATETKL